MENLFDPRAVQAALEYAGAWLLDNVLVLSTLLQLAAVLVAFLAARLAAPRAETWIKALSRRAVVEARAHRLAQALAPLTLPFVWLVFQWLSVFVAASAGWPHHVIEVAVSLVTAWVVIRLASGVVKEPEWARAITAVVWTIAALNILNLLGPTIDFLDSLAVTIGELRISVLTLIKAVFYLTVLLWMAVLLSRLLERRISALPSLTPSIQVLFTKLLKVALVTIAVVAALASVGLDLTALAVFGGALGVGIGFGLQKVVSNLVSGIILLLDKSIKPGDVIAVANTYGWVNSLGARYASVITRDGIEHLIPNEEFITQRVENWSYSNRLVRLRMPIGVSYKSDVRKAMELCLEAAREAPRVLATPAPICLLAGFGDSSVDLEMRIWIADPANGVANVKSAVLLGVWDRFHEQGIEIPFPQRDVHVRTPSEIRVWSADGGAGAGPQPRDQALEAGAPRGET